MQRQLFYKQVNLIGHGLRTLIIGQVNTLMRQAHLCQCPQDFFSIAPRFRALYGNLCGITLHRRHSDQIKARVRITLESFVNSQINRLFISNVRTIDQIQDGVDAGRSTQADMEQAKARLAAAKATESSTRQALRNAESQYRSDVGDAPGQLSMPVIPYDVLSASAEQEVEKVLAYSPTLDIFESDIEVAYAEAHQTRSTFYPQVDFQLNGRTGHDINGVEGTDTSASALVVVNWNLYRGGADMARSREFLHRHQQSKESRAEAARQVENDVRQTWAAMVSAGERAREFAAQADANVEVVKAYKDQHKSY